MDSRRGSAMKSHRRCDIVAGAFVALLGAITVYAASRIRGDVEERLPPRTLPYIVGFVLLFTGAGLALKSWRSMGPDPEIHWPDGQGWTRIAVNLLLLAVFVLLIGLVGMPIATALYVATTIWYLDRKRTVGALTAGACTALVVYFLFMKFLELPFPIGILGR